MLKFFIKANSLTLISYFRILISLPLLFWFKNIKQLRSVAEVMQKL